MSSAANCPTPENLATSRSCRKPGPKFPPEAQEEPLQALARAAPRLALAVEAISPRRDVRALRARVVLLLLRLRCPRGGTPTRTWYVPGAVARLGAGGVGRVWADWWTAPPPSERRLRDHLEALERGLVLVRAPGAWLPTLRDPDDPRRHRYPDTFHVLEEDRDAVWWSQEGAAVLARFPEVRTNPSEWAKRVGDWRIRKPVQGLLFDELAAALSSERTPRALDPAEARDADAATATALEELVRSPPGTHAELLGRLDSLGAPLRGKPRFQVLKNPRRLLAVLALLARGLRRSRIIRNRSGWIVRAYERARSEELAEALDDVLGTEPGGNPCRTSNPRAAGSAAAPKAAPAFARASRAGG